LPEKSIFYGTGRSYSSESFEGKYSGKVFKPGGAWEGGLRPENLEKMKGG
jgi:hypothetical protein